MSLMTLQLSLCVLIVMQVMYSECSYRPGPPPPSQPGDLGHRGDCCRIIARRMSTERRRNRQLWRVVAKLRRDFRKINTKGELKKAEITAGKWLRKKLVFKNLQKNSKVRNLGF